MTEVYKSTTHGPIPLSFTGRHLMQSLREATIAAIAKNDWHTAGEALSRARGDLAAYMSTLEGRAPFTNTGMPAGMMIRSFSDAELVAEIERRLMEETERKKAEAARKRVEEALIKYKATAPCVCGAVDRPLGVKHASYCPAYPGY